MILAIKEYHRRVKLDPLKFFRFKSVGQRKLIDYIGKKGWPEVYWRSSNQGGKTYGGAFLGVALARGEASIDGRPIPVLDSPNIGFVLVQGYKQSSTATLQAYRQAIGKWPHKEGKIDPALDHVSRIYVKPTHSVSDKHEDWSQIIFISDEGTPPAGARIDWAQMDEPCSFRNWDEVRSRTRANKPFIKFITATPLHKKDWKWLKEDFKACRDIVVEGRIEIVTELDDNKALSKEHKDRQKQQWKNSEFYDARVAGEYVDIEGQCPFPRNPMSRWMKKARTATPATALVQKERDTKDGRVFEQVSVEYEIFHEYDDQFRYYMVVDPSLGIKDKLHDPAAIHIYCADPDRAHLAVRYNGYIPPMALGSLAAQMGSNYGKCPVDVDNTGGYGEGVITALSMSRYTNIASDDFADQPGKISNRLGFRITAANRAEIISSIQRALIEDSVLVESRGVVDTLMNCVVDPNGKVLATAGEHDEDMICLGRFCHTQEKVKYCPPTARRMTGIERLQAMITGKVPHPRQHREPIESW